MKLDEAFRYLRNAWFYKHLRSYAHERHWEEQDELDLREKQNKELKKRFDEETEGIIRGEDFCIDPTCTFDMNHRIINLYK